MPAAVEQPPREGAAVEEEEGHCEVLQ